MAQVQPAIVVDHLQAAPGSGQDRAPIAVDQQRGPPCRRQGASTGLASALCQRCRAEAQVVEAASLAVVPVGGER